MRPVFVLLGVLASAISNPIIIRTGLNKDQGQQQDSKVYDHSSVKGIANYEGEEGFNRDNESKHVKAQNAGNYDEGSANKNVHLNENNFADDKYQQQGGNQFSDFDKKNAHKKGHHKSGFTKSYHKDESESNSSFYDDEDNQGGEVVHNTNKNAYGDATQQNRRGSDLDDRRYAQEQAKKGYYDTAGNYEKGLNNQQDYHKKKYYDDKENQAQRNAANQYGEGNRYSEEKYVRKPHYVEPYPIYDSEPYYDNHRPVSVPKRTITIYEDPRYDGGAGYEARPHYEDDYVQLDYRRPPRDYPDYRYYEPRPTSYDYYY